MSAAAAIQPADGRDGDRRALILAAAERAFLQKGFHATSMQDVAAEAGMSPGNLYRYFPSKEAIVAGLCARDQAMLAENVRVLLSFGEGQANTAMVFVAIVMLTVVGGIAYLAVILAERRVLHYLPARGYQGF